MVALARFVGCFRLAINLTLVITLVLADLTLVTTLALIATAKQLLAFTTALQFTRRRILRAVPCVLQAAHRYVVPPPV